MSDRLTPRAWIINLESPHAEFYIDLRAATPAAAPKVESTFNTHSFH